MVVRSYRRCVYLLSAAVALTSLPALALSLQEPGSAPCVPSAPGLSYPQAALSARIMGTVWTTAAFSNEGSVASIESKGHPLLVLEVASALRSAAPTSMCAGQKVRMEFDFIISPDLKPTTPTSVHALSAFKYEVVAPAEIIETTIADPAWIFSRKGRFLHRVKTALAKLTFWRG